VNEAVGKDVAQHPTLDLLHGCETRKSVIPATRKAVLEFLKTHAR
jgi:hypothetical protein